MKKIFFYALATCPGCRKTKKFFIEHNVDFEYMEYDNATEDEQARIQKEMDTSGSPAFPWVRIGEDVVVGFNPARYAELLGIRLEKKPWER